MMDGVAFLEGSALPFLSSLTFRLAVPETGAVPMSWNRKETLPVAQTKETAI